VITGAVGLLGVAPAANAELRVSPNQRVTNDPSSFRGKDMPSLAVNPNNPQHIVATNSDYLDEACEASASFDGGATWSEAAQLTPPAQAVGNPFMASCRVSNHAGESMFQGVVFGSGNNVYATSITPKAAGTAEEGASALIYKSTNGGVTFTPGIVSLPGGTGGSVATGPYYELPSVVVDPAAGTGGADIVYSVARDASGSGNAPCAVSRCDAVRVARSLDGGATFGAPVQASPTGTPTIDAAHPALGANGSLNITWRTIGSTGEIQFVRSTDQGQTWSKPVNVTTVTNIARAFNSHVTPQASSASSFPRIAANRTNGNLYIVYNQGGSGPTAPAGGYQGADHFIPPDSAVWFQRSVDNGVSWSTPKRISENAAVHPGTQIHQTRHPDVKVSSGGRVDIAWEDRRHWYQGPGERTCVHTHIACDDARLGDTYYSFSSNDGAAFSANRRLSDFSHNNDVGYDYRFATYWAFGPSVAPMGASQLMVGWMDSREGSFDSDNQDVYLAKADHAASGAAPQTNVAETDPIALSVALSKFGYKGGGEGLMLSNFATRNGTRVVIVNKDDAPGAIAASVLARANLSPVLLSDAGGLSASAKAEVARLNPAGAFIVGDASSLSAQVATDLAAAGIDAAQVTRVAGTNNAGTAAAIAAAMDKRSAAEKTAGVPAFDAAVIANPAGPDAAAATALAAARRLPILYVSTNAVPADTSAALSSLNINKTLVIGGADQVSSDVRFGLPNSDRLGEGDQYGTSKAVAKEAVERGLPTNQVYVANGARPMDAALLGAVVGRATGIMVLARGPANSTAAATAAGAGLTGIDRLNVVNGAFVPPVVTPPPPPAPPAATPPPPPTVVPGPPPPPTVVPVVPPRKGGKLSATITPRSDTRSPYVFRTRGKLTLPSGITRANGCSGRVSVQVKRGNTTISTRRVSLSRTCTYSSKVTFTSRKRFASFKRLKFTARFLGNRRVSPVSATPRFAQVRR